MDRDYDPDAPVTHSHAGGVRHTHRDPSIKHDPHPDLDPDPIPNIVLHPGDTLAVDIHDPASATVRLLDGNGHCYATLDCDRTRPDEYRIASLYWSGGRRVLPVRAEPEPDVQSVPVQDTTNPTTTLSSNYPDAVTLSAGAIAHYHHHAHGTAAGDVLTHSHKHEHTGAESRRANELGHTADVHAHPH